MSPPRPQEDCALATNADLHSMLAGSAPSPPAPLSWGTVAEMAAAMAPLPQSVSVDPAGWRMLTTGQTVVLKPGDGATQSPPDSAMVPAAAERLARMVDHASGGAIKLFVCVESACPAGSAPAITVEWAGADPAVIPTKQEESYRLTAPAGAAAGPVVLSAAGPIAALRGLATLAQLLRADRGSVAVQAVAVEDAPAHHWRGLLIDVSRHFLSMERLWALLPLCAAVKINVLHVHLTDDQGWRYESTVFPELNRPASTGGGFYFKQVGDAGAGAFCCRRLII